MLQIENLSKTYRLKDRDIVALEECQLHHQAG